jgi:hypothetical protein
VVGLDRSRGGREQGRGRKAEVEQARLARYFSSPSASHARSLAESERTAAARRPSASCSAAASVVSCANCPSAYYQYWHHPFHSRRATGMRGGARAGFEGSRCGAGRRRKERHRRKPRLLNSRMEGCRHCLIRGWGIHGQD